MRVKDEIDKSEKYFTIMKLIFTEKNYNDVIAKGLNINPNSAIKHIKYLENKKFIIQAKSKNQYNKKTYSLNFETLSKEFIDFLIMGMMGTLKPDDYELNITYKETIKRMSECVKKAKKLNVGKAKPEIKGFVEKSFIIILEPEFKAKNLNDVFFGLFNLLVHVVKKHNTLPHTTKYLEKLKEIKKEAYGVKKNNIFDSYIDEFL